MAITSASGASATEAGEFGPMPSASRRLPRASDILSNAIRAEILGKKLPPGTVLPSEAELIEQYEYSRASVREALRLLEVDGLIIIRRGSKGGIKVRYPDVSQVSRSCALLFHTRGATLEDFCDFRNLVEPAAAADAARKATDAQRQDLKDFLDRGGRPTHGALTPPAFHTLVGRCSNNVVSETMVSALNQILEWHSAPHRLSDHDIRDADRAHLAIAKSIVDRDADKASRLMTKHLTSYRDVLAAQGRLSDSIVPASHWEIG